MHAEQPTSRQASQEWDQQDNFVAMGEPASTCALSRPFLGKLKRNIMHQPFKRQRPVGKTKRRHRARAELPQRLTNCIFQKPVTRVTSHPDNHVRSMQGEPRVRPQQACGYRRLQGLQAYSDEGELLSTLNITNAMKIITPRISVEYLGCITPETLHSSPEPTTKWSSSDWAQMVPGTCLSVPRPPCQQLITLGDIQRQNFKVRKARERLAAALREDRLAREAERARSQEGHRETE